MRPTPAMRRSMSPTTWCSGCPQISTDAAGSEGAVPSAEAAAGLPRAALISPSASRLKAVRTAAPNRRAVGL